MIIDYIGQELIWNLTATHPYKKNMGNYCINIRCETLKQNEEWVRFFKLHLKNKFLTIENQNHFDRTTGLNYIVAKKISVPDAFGGFGQVSFINEFVEG